MQSLQRTVSDFSFHLTTKEAATGKQLPAVGEAAAVLEEGEEEMAKCECCGMAEEFTPQYVKRVRDKFMGKMVCGMCAEAIGREAEKNGGEREAAVKDHMKACARFNGLGRKYPVLYQADAVKEILKKKRSQAGKAAAGAGGGGGLARSSSCMPAIARDLAAAGGQRRQ
ncbi:unnamed protein product [Linum tenue]|uniref:DUF1677 family protein n=1 Tax=Linum tenue TaxID=586396 RepID=A0AAV0JH06_9ROSI|nr:unnamed protein product [Linum tenue]